MNTFKTLPPNFTISDDGNYAVLSVPIEKSDNDDRSYRLIKLSNELEALLVHDAKADKSGVTLDVCVGNSCDPDNLPGLAHFCEHLLFMGTEKYPKENDYKEYILSHGGISNASTAYDRTKYYFEIGPEFLEGALDRFAQFFVAPLFNESCVDREINAVDSEYKKNLRLDARRFIQLEKSLFNQKHPYSHFGTGNLKTLKEIPDEQGINIRDELLKFHDKYYSANIMKLVVIGKEPLDQLVQWVVEKFSAVKNKGISEPTFEGHPLTENELLKQVFVKPVKDVRGLKISFPFPDQEPLFRVKPGSYLSRLIGHEGVGSILSLLKKKGWANSLDAVYTRYPGFGFFDILIDLTESGLANYEDVVVYVFQYIEMLKQVGVQEWIFREVKQLREISFRFKEKTSPSAYCLSLAYSMQIPYPREWILSISLVREYDPQLIKESLDLLRHDRFFLRLASQSFTGLDQKEKWYGTEYKVEPLSDKLIQALKKITIHPELKLPMLNEFIPTNFETNKIEVSMPAKRPNLIKNTRTSRLWYKKDDTFWVPKAKIYITLNSSLAYATPSHHVRTTLYTELVKDALNEYMYDARIAGVGYNITCQIRGLLLILSGYNDKLQILLEKIVIKMKNLKVDPERFLLIKEKLQRTYKNLLMEQPYQHANYYLNYLVQDTMWTHEEKLEALQYINYEDVEMFYPDLLRQLYFESLIHGNILKDDAIKMLQNFEETLQSKVYIQPLLMNNPRTAIIPEGKRFVYQKNAFDSNNVNSAIEYYIQIGDLIDKGLRTKLSLISQITREPCFNNLRTKEQLGYIVHSGLQNKVRSLGLCVKVQSEKDTVHLENRIEAFLDKLQTIIEEMPEQDYQKNIQSLIIKMLEKPKNLFQETQEYWDSISSGYYDFERDYEDAEELRKIEKQDLLEFYKKFINPASPTCRKLSVHFRSQKLSQQKKLLKPIDIDHLHTCLFSQGLTTITIQDLQNFKSSTKSELNESELDLEYSLKKFLIEKVKGDENEIEKLAKEISKSYLDGVKKDDDDMKSEELELQLKDCNDIIYDMVSWKSSINLGPTATPLVKFDDLTN